MYLFTAPPPGLNAGMLHEVYLPLSGPGPELRSAYPKGTAPKRERSIFQKGFQHISMRVIGGKFRSRGLASLEGSETRPTYDRLKETLFNVLASAGKLDGIDFLDLFAGTGSIGIEALSRGAAAACFVENHHRAARVITTNLKTLGIGSEAEVFECDASEGLRRLSERQRGFHVIFMDPPYKMQGAYEQTLRIVSENCGESSQDGLLHPGGILVAEHEKRFDPGEGTANLVRYRTLIQGESSLSFYRSR